MADYLVKMADERGRVTEQTEKGFSEDEVRNRYVQQGYLVYSVKPRGLLGKQGWRLATRRKVKLSQFVIFNQQFLTLFRAGLPIVQGLELLAKREKNKFFHAVLEDVRDRVKGANPCRKPSKRKEYSPRFTRPRCWRASAAETWTKCSPAI